jgi:uncharacterized SAM-binding protein YcdF (DUF218 family)
VDIASLIIVFKGLIKMFAMPPGIFIVGLVVFGLRKIVRRQSAGHAATKKTGWAMLGLAAALYLSFLPWLANATGHWIERNTKPLAIKSDGKIDARDAQAIVILAGGIRSEAIEYKVPEVPNWRTLERLVYGAQLARDTGLPVLVSGGILPMRNTGSEAAAMARSLQTDFGIAVKWREEQSLDTLDNANFSAKILKAEGITRVLVVTHASHLPRSIPAFERAGMKAIAAPTSFTPDPPQTIFTWLPSAWAGARLFDNLHEIIGAFWYDLVALVGKK